MLTVIGFYIIKVEDKCLEKTEPAISSLATESKPLKTKEVQHETADSGISNVHKGQAFEEYVISKFDFSRKSLTLLSQADNSSSTTKPDLDIKLSAGGKEYRFATECVWRQNMPQETLDWCKEGKIEALKSYEKKMNAKVFIVVGIGGTPSKPAKLYIIPFNERPYANIYRSVLCKYEVTSTDGKFFYETSTNILTIK